MILQSTTNTVRHSFTPESVQYSANNTFTLMPLIWPNFSFLRLSVLGRAKWPRPANWAQTLEARSALRRPPRCSERRPSPDNACAGYAGLAVQGRHSSFFRIGHALHRSGPVGG
eukprot:13026520-Heterocapsa_arctica.AAC.1